MKTITVRSEKMFMSNKQGLLADYVCSCLQDRYVIEHQTDLVI